MSSPSRVFASLALGVAALTSCQSSTTTPLPEPVVAEATPVVATTPAPGTGEHVQHLTRGMHRYHPPGEKKITGPTACSSPLLTYYGGPLLQSAEIVAVFWNADVNPVIQANIGQFYADVTHSTYWGLLQEYGSAGKSPGSNQAILPGTYKGGILITPSICPATGSTTACTVTDAHIQSELNAQIQAGVLPAPSLDCTGNVQTIYMVSFPPKISVVGPNGVGDSCTDFCAYHNTGTTSTNEPLVYAALLDNFSGPCATGCGGASSPLENSTETASHELIEAVTDTDIGLDQGFGYQYPAGWGDNDNKCGEIADICDNIPGAAQTISVEGRQWTVQRVWSNVQQLCTTTGTNLPVCSGTTTTGCRPCSCGDNGGACNGATSVCETDRTNVNYRACEQCTATSGTCTTCQQSATAAMDDVCVGCTPDACGAGENCGSVPNSCGGVTLCGQCGQQETCGGATPSVANACGCTPLTACPTGYQCGTAFDGCGGTIDCGTCPTPETCGGGFPFNPNLCVCIPATVCPPGYQCGEASDGCGGMIDCGSCAGAETCTANKCLMEGSSSSGAGGGASASGAGGASTSSATSSVASSSGTGQGGSTEATSTSTSPSSSSGAPLGDSGKFDCGCAVPGSSNEAPLSEAAALVLLGLAASARKRRRAVV